jgi:alcohol dehydrogenase class IV
MSAQSMMRLPHRILFGAGSIEATGAATRPLGTSALVCTDDVMVDSEAFLLARASLERAGVDVHVFSGTRPDLPLDDVLRCGDFARSRQIDLVVALGGGSCIDMAKAAAVVLGARGELSQYYGENLIDFDVIPIVAIPTTAGTGSEVTPVAVITDPGRHLKVGISSPRLIPTVAICDATATIGCPPTVTAHAGIDALIHAVEAYCAPPRVNPWETYPGDVFRGANRLTEQYALQAVGLIGGALESAVADGGNAAARDDMLLGSLCAGIAFSHAGTAAAHALQYPIGAATGTPHGLGVGLLAPYTLQASRPDADAALQDVARALGIGERGDAAAAAVDELERLGGAVGLPASLREIGVALDDLERYATEASKIERLIRNSPRPMTVADLLAVLVAAWHGDRGLVPASPEPTT